MLIGTAQVCTEAAAVQHMTMVRPQAGHAQQKHSLLTYKYTVTKEQ